MEIINVAYATDDNYAQHVSVSLYSLFSKLNENTQLSVFILANKLSQQHRNNIKSTISDNRCEIFFIDISNIEELLGITVNVNSLSISTYSRLFLADLLPQTIDKILYLDCDTVILDDITTLYHYDISAYSLGAILDHMYADMKNDIYLTDNDYYVNAGVLLINLKKWRETNIKNKFINFIYKFEGKVPHLDQGVINGVIKDKKILPLNYNVQSPIFSFNDIQDLREFYNLSGFYSDDEIENAKRHPSLIHFTSFFVERPWFVFCLHPYRDLYRKYLSFTPYHNVKLKENQISFWKKVKNYTFVHFQKPYLFFKRIWKD